MKRDARGMISLGLNPSPTVPKKDYCPPATWARVAKLSRCREPGMVRLVSAQIAELRQVAQRQVERDTALLALREAKLVLEMAVAATVWATELLKPVGS